MHYSLSWLPNRKDKLVGKIQLMVCGRNEEERPALSSHAHTTNERTKMHDSSESFKLSLATTDRDTRASLSFPSSNYSEFMIALKFVHSDKHSVIKDKLALHDCLSRSVAATKPNDPLTHRTHDARTKGRNAMRASRSLMILMLWPQNVERVSLSFPSSNFSHGTSTPCRYSQAEVWG